MASFDLVGNLKVKGETTSVTDKFMKREFVVITDLNSQYPQYISFQLSQDKCPLLDSFEEGDEIKVHFNLRGREWNGPQGLRYFNSLDAWRLEKVTAGSGNSGSNVATPTAAPGVMNTQEVADDLPF